MADSDYQKPEPQDYVTDPDTKKTTGYTQKPGVMDYLKEAFMPSIQRAQLEAIRNAREKAGL
jgi:hypothetical protein